MPQTIRARPSGMAIFDVPGSCSGGTMPMRLFIAMKKNSVARNGTKRRPSLPMVSRPMPLRTKPYADSPTNCSLPGTRPPVASARRAASQNSRPTRNVESTTMRTTLSTSHAPMLKNGAGSKSLGPGGLKPPPSAARSVSLTASFLSCPGAPGPRRARAGR